MAYTPQLAIDFWIEFDNLFLDNPSAEIIQAYGQLGGDIDRPRKRWTAHRRNGTYPAGFVADMQSIRDPLLVLGEKQIETIDKHFQGDREAEQRAFEDFAQGILWDGRRPQTRKLHMMDTSGPANPPIGYHRWHTFIRAIVAVGGDADRWLIVDRNVSLAWAIQSLLKPVQDTHDNPPLTSDQLKKFREKWLTLSVEQLDDAFDSFPYPKGEDI
jgi:hypothetical protein